MEIWTRLFDASGFVPRAQCGEWTPELIRLHNGSDFFIWAAYLAIPVVLVRFAWRRRHELPFAQLFWLFGLFIVACGTTHLMDIVLFYNPMYRLAGAVKLVTAAASWGTVCALIPIVPRALAMRSPEALQREIDVREQAEAEVRLLNQELEKRVLERTAQLEAANREKDALLVREQDARREAEAANRSKDEFLATLSHELRTPLSSMLAWTSLMQSGRLDAATSIKGVETIDRLARTQAQLVEDLVDVSRIITGNMRLIWEPLDLASLVRDTQTSLHPSAQGKNLRVEIAIPEEPILVRGDTRRLQQVVANLLSNAIKFTPEGGQIHIRVESGEGRAVLTVRDAGEGIPPEFLPHIFDRFRQADSSNTRRHGGLGLGLALVHHLVELHSGHVEAHSDGLGTGATFTVSLPLLGESNNGNEAA
jgi:signal transduction histidine kinase